METIEKINEILNDLIRINHDRAEGYKKLVEQLPDTDIDLKYLFKQFIYESEQYADKLSCFVLKNGGNPSSTTTLSGKIYRMWMQIRLDRSNAERLPVLTSCEFGEDAAQRAYKQALEADVKMPEDIREAVMGQKLALKSAHDEIRHYRDLLITQ